MRDATSPALCPPMPSAMMQSARRLSIAKQSSLDGRTRPVSLMPKTRSTSEMLLRLERGKVERRAFDLQGLQLRPGGNAVHELTGVFGHRSDVDELDRRVVDLVVGGGHGRTFHHDRLEV